MLYIITYATHNSGYFNLLKNNKDIIVLGFGEKWTGFHNKVNGTVNFCKSKKPDDIVCFLDGFDSIIISSDKNEIINKFKSFNKKLVFSKDTPPKHILNKYFQDKIFNYCNDYHLNSGMYIGYVKDIINLWSNFNEIDDDQTFATNKCSINSNIIIDLNYILFYNFCIWDKKNITFDNKRIIINNNKPCFISAPGQNNMNNILQNIGYNNNLPIFNIYDRYKFRLKNYSKLFINELIILIIILLLFYYKNKNLNVLTKIIISFILFLELIHYELYLKNFNIDFINKFLYILIDIVHISISIIFAYLLLNFKYNIHKLLLLNILIFFYLKQPFISIIKSNLLKINNYEKSNTIFDRLLYFTNIKNKYFYECNKNLTEQWIDINKIEIILVIILNIYCLYNIYYKNI
jgi:hypothetical protein